MFNFSGWKIYFMKEEQPVTGTIEVLKKAQQNIEKDGDYNYHSWGHCAVGNIHAAAVGRYQGENEVRTPKDPVVGAVWDDIAKSLGVSSQTEYYTRIFAQNAISDRAEVSQLGRSGAAKQKAIQVIDEVIEAVEKAHNAQLKA